MARPATAAVTLLTGAREPVRAATTGNITLQGLQTIDGVDLGVGHRVLVKDQTDATENGIYDASEGPWYRSSDARSSRTIQKGTTVYVQEGSANAATNYTFQTLDPDIGADAIVITYSSTGILDGIVNGYRKMRNLFREVDLYNYMENEPTVVGETNDAWDRFVADINATGVRPITVHIPTGMFYLDRTIAVPTNFQLDIACDGGYSTQFLADPTGTFTNGAMMGPADTSQLSHLKMHGGLFHGQSVAGYGIRLDKAVHSTFDQIEIRGCTAWAMRLNGFSNTIKTPKFYGNTGGGLDISGVDVDEGLGNSNTNIEGGIIYANGAIGMKLANGWSMNVRGTGIEGNGVAGLISYCVDGLNVLGSYFERNGATGLELTGTALGTVMTVHADIFLLSETVALDYMGSLSGVRGAVIDGCSFTPYGTYNYPSPGLGQDCFVFATSLDRLRFTNNAMREPDRVTAAVGVYNYFGYAQCLGLVIENNDRNDVGFIGVGTAASSFNTAHNISNRYAVPFNYAPQAIGSWTAASGTTGTLTDSLSDYGPHDIWQITPGDKLWAYTLDLNAQPHLKGKRVWFGVNYRMLETCGLRLWCGGNTDNYGVVTETATAAGVWNTKSVMKEIGASDTTLTIAMNVTGGTTTGVVVACPMLCEVGVNASDAMRVT